VARNLSLIALAVVFASAPALAQAQSKRYPPKPVDADKDAEKKSHLWDSALDPERKPYDELVTEARRKVEERTPDSAKLAVTLLDQAIKRIPKDPRAYALRGEAHLVLEHWAACASDLAFVDANAPPGTSPDRERQMIELGVCQGRAGQLADAERTLAHAVATTPRGDQWMRLGEVRIALGKLDEAIDALDAAFDTPDAPKPIVEWLLALAYDRARRPSDSETHATNALRYDVAFNTLARPQYPWLRAGESEYLLGLARQARKEPEYALAYFRQFLRLAPDSPWKRRAEEHVRELAALDQPQTIQREASSSAIVDIPAIQPIIRKAMPALRACVAKQPTTVYTIAIVKNGPATPESVRDRPRYKMPPPGAKAEANVNIEPVPTDDAKKSALLATEAAVKRCLEPIADRIPLPAPKDRDTWYRITFLVIAP